MTERTEIKVGDFFVRSYGYDQTNVDFFKVVGFTASGKSVRVQHWSKSVTCQGQPQEYVTPGEEPTTAIDRSKGEDGYDWDAMRYHRVTAPVETKLLIGSRKDMLRWDSYSYCRIWDGTPQYQTGAGWGH